MKQETIQKYLEALKEIKFNIWIDSKIALGPFCESKGLSKNAAFSMMKLGIIINQGGRGKSRNYKWVARDPDLVMATDLLKMVNEIGSSSVSKSRKKLIKNSLEDFNDDAISFVEKLRSKYELGTQVKILKSCKKILILFCEQDLIDLDQTKNLLQDQLKYLKSSKI